jgi:GTP-binding protein EngB required for normal cell division
LFDATTANGKIIIMAKAGKIQLIKYAPPPPELPEYGKIEPGEVSFIGRTNYVASLEEKRYIFGIKRVDRRRHLYIIGKSGVGKSKLQELMVRQDIAMDAIAVGWTHLKRLREVYKNEDT